MTKKLINGIETYFLSDKFSVVRLDNQYVIRIFEDNEWQYPLWSENSFDTLDDAELWLLLHAIKNATTENIDYNDDIFSNIIITNSENRQKILAASSKDYAKDLVRVKSSNIWSYGFKIENRKDVVGDVIIQFKNLTGGPGDIYIYYDVPTTVYRNWQSAPSKGHYFWVNIRNNYRYSKLTGDKRGHLPNAIN